MGSTPVYGAKIVTNLTWTMTGHKKIALTALFILVCTPPYLLADDHSAGGVSTGLSQMGDGEKAIRPPPVQDNKCDLNCTHTTPAETDKLNALIQQEHDKELEMLEKLLIKSEQPKANLPPPYQGNDVKKAHP